MLFLDYGGVDQDEAVLEEGQQGGGFGGTEFTIVKVSISGQEDLQVCFQPMEITWGVLILIKLLLEWHEELIQHFLAFLLTGLFILCHLLLNRPSHYCILKPPSLVLELLAHRRGQGKVGGGYGQGVHGCCLQVLTQII